MADELDVLLEKVADPQLRAELRTAVDKVRAKRNFGLVFESHLPERVRLPEHPVRRGATVVLRADKHGEPMTVRTVKRGQAYVADAEGARHSVPVADLVVVAEFGEPVYPGLTRVGEVRRGGDKPAHVVINAENHHALEMLQFTHAGKVDCIYIDPPYNTGAKDWKYDNNYVDSDDAYRHSKWLAFMERRLLLAKQLLNPDNSVLIVTIDEKEYLRLGLLLQQTFPSATQQMVTIVINPSGSSRAGQFSRSDEYAFIIQLGDARVVPTGDDMLNAGSASPRFDVRWDSLRRRGNASRRSRIPSLFYPIYFDRATGKFHGVGAMVPAGRSRPKTVDGLDCVLPVTDDGAEMTWNLSPEGFQQRLEAGCVRYYRTDSGDYVIRFLQQGTIDAIERGEVVNDGLDEHGFPRWVFRTARRMSPMTTWHRQSHSASDHGTPVLGALLPGRHFPYPKSLYAVEDAIRFFVADKPDAVIVDFFVGSGTTAHAVMRLNRQDGGRRQAIVVTNNEVSADEAKALTEQGYRDGDPEWEALGIFEYITRPRITAAVTGLTPDGTPIKGDYKFTDEFPMAEGFEENVEFMKLTYLDPVDVELDRAFAAVAPMLWMRAGGQGSMIEQRTDAAGELLPFAVADRYGVLFDPDRWREFVGVLPATAGTVFVVTDSAAVFAGVAENLPTELEAVRLYENYLTTFAINRGRGA